MNGALALTVGKRCRQLSLRIGHCRISDQPRAGCRKRHVRIAAEAQAIFCRRRHQPSRPPLANSRPGEARLRRRGRER
jgi:hypothetical protein